MMEGSEIGRGGRRRRTRETADERGGWKGDHGGGVR